MENVEFLEEDVDDYDQFVLGDSSSVVVVEPKEVEHTMEVVHDCDEIDRFWDNFHESDTSVPTSSRFVDPYSSAPGTHIPGTSASPDVSVPGSPTPGTSADPSVSVSGSPISGTSAFPYVSVRGSPVPSTSANPSVSVPGSPVPGTS